MIISVEISYVSNGNRVLQRAEFPLERRKPEAIAYEWFKQIRRGMPFGAELEKVIAAGEDITELVKAIDRAPLSE